MSKYNGFSVLSRGHICFDDRVISAKSESQGPKVLTINFRVKLKGYRKQKSITCDSTMGEMKKQQEKVKKGHSVKRLPFVNFPVILVWEQE